MPENLGSHFAIKVMRKDRLAKNEKTVKSILIEYQVLFEANHANICSIHWFYQTSERLFFVMPFVSGGELASVLKAKSRFSEKLAKFYTAQLLEAFTYIHENQLLHRDLKLQNILLDQDGYLKVIDFGLAR